MRSMALRHNAARCVASSGAAVTTMRGVSLGGGRLLGGADLGRRRLLHSSTPSPTTTLRYPAAALAQSALTPATSTPRRTLSKAPVSLAAAPVRHCSHRRNMCRHMLNPDEGGAVDITQAREILPANVKPLHYDLTLEPDFEKFTYEGKVAIEYAAALGFSRTASRRLTPPTGWTLSRTRRPSRSTPSSSRSTPPASPRMAKRSPSPRSWSTTTMRRRPRSRSTRQSPPAARRR